MKKLISLIILLCCFAALGFCLYLRSNATPPQSAPPQEEPAAAATPPVEAAPESGTGTPSSPDAAGTAESGTEADIVPKENTPDYLSAYAPVFESYRLWLAGSEPEMSDSTERGDYYLVLGETGISFLCRYAETLGYALLDMDSNGTPELLIGSDEGEYQGKYIFDMFTLVDGAPRRVLVSSERVAYMLYQDNQILHQGSGGASYSFMGIYRYSGTELEMVNGVVMAGDDQYYEVFGEGTSIFYERLPGDTPITREEFFAKMDAMEANEATIPLQPLQ